MTNRNNTETISSPSGKCVSFRGVVRVREHERILVDTPDKDVPYACLAIGWAHESSDQCLLDESPASNDTEDTVCRAACSGTNKESSQRYSAAERMKVLNDYGFGMQEVLRNEMIKKKKCTLSTRRGCKSSPQPSSSQSSKSGVKRLFAGWGSRKKVC